MAGVKLLRKIQIGQEVTAGTAVAATAIWRGMGLLEDQREVKFAEEEVGYISGTDRVYTPKLGAQVQLADVEATFEQLPYLLEAGVKTVTPSADGTGSGYVYAYTFPTTALNTIKTLTIEGGDNQQAEEIEYCFTTDFKLSGAPGEAVMMGGNLTGRQATNTSFTGGLSLAGVNTILFGKGKLYIDDASGTIGSTQVSSTLLGFTLNVNTGIIPKYTADGNLYFTVHQFTAPEITLDLTYEHNASAVTEKTAWRSQTARLIRLIFEGNALTSAGTYTYKSLIIDLAGRYEKFDVLGDLDGNDTIGCTFRSRYDLTADFFASITVVNELASLT